MSLSQVTLVSLEELVSEEHQYRKFKELFNFNKIQAELTSVEPASNYKGYGVERLFKCLLLQFMEDLSDRELERYLSDSNAAKLMQLSGFANLILEKLPLITVFLVS